MKINDELCTETFLGNLIAYVPSKDDDLKLLEKYQKAKKNWISQSSSPLKYVQSIWLSAFI